MKQKHFKIVLLTICVLLLAVALVACGEKDKNKFGVSDSSGNGIWVNGIPTDAELDACIAYVYNNTRQGDKLWQIQIGKFEVTETSWLRADNFFSIGGYDCHLQIFSYPDSKSAEKDIPYYKEYLNEGIIHKDNLLIYMYDYSDADSVAKGLDEAKEFYEKVMASKLPAGAISDVRYKFIKDTFKKYGNKNALKDIKEMELGFLIDETREESLGASIIPMDKDEETTIIYTNSVERIERLREEELPHMDEWYTSDSYIDFEKEEGFVFAQLTEKVHRAPSDYENGDE